MHLQRNAAPWTCVDFEVGILMYRALHQRAVPVRHGQDGVMHLQQTAAQQAAVTASAATTLLDSDL
jgi:hypothetical protein